MWETNIARVWPLEIRTGASLSDHSAYCEFQGSLGRQHLWMAYKKGTGSSDFYSFLIKLHAIELKLISYILFTLTSIVFKIISSVNIYHATMVPFF